MAEVAERSTVDILRAARERITPFEHWCRNAFAKNVFGGKVGVEDLTACQWCATGAVLAEIDAEHPAYYESLAATEAWDFLKQAAGARTPEGVNDGDGHAAVLAMFDHAIQLAEQESA